MVYVVGVAGGPSLGTVWAQDNRGLTLCLQSLETNTGAYFL